MTDPGNLLNTSASFASISLNYRDHCQTNFKQDFQTILPCHLDNDRTIEENILQMNVVFLNAILSSFR